MKQSPTWFDVYLVNVKSSGRLFQIFVAFSECPNFNKIHQANNWSTKKIPFCANLALKSNVFYAISVQNTLHIWSVVRWPIHWKLSKIILDFTFWWGDAEHVLVLQMVLAIYDVCKIFQWHMIWKIGAY